LFDTVFHESIAAPRGGLSREEVFSLFGLSDLDHDAAAAA
jgi:hypothetical protein